MLPLARSPETLFIFHTTEFIMSGLVFVVLLWLAWKGPVPRKQGVGWIFTFLLLVVSFGLGGWASYRLLVETQEYALAPLHYAASGLLETAGLAVLAWSMLRATLGSWAALAFLPVVAELAALLYGGASLDYPPSLYHSIAAMAVASFGFVGARARGELRYAGFALLLLAVAHLISSLSGLGTSTELNWSLASALTLFGLTGLALAVERRSRDLFIQVFIRLNLAFIFLAGVLMVLASQAERNKRMDFSRRELEEMAEFLRGHAMYYMEKSESAENILSSQVIFHRIVTDFGHHPDLRIVRVQVGERELAVTIDEDGMIGRELRTVSTDATGRQSYRSPTVMVGQWPIFFGDRAVGKVTFEETRLSVNQETAESILVIFFAFTSAVTIASLLIGVIVYHASERLRRQVRQIEQSERQLMHAAKLASLGELVSGVAHEINNPLGVIFSRTDYLQEIIPEGVTRDELSEDLGAIRRQAHRIGRIVQDLLSFARPHRMELKSVSIQSVVERSLELTTAHLRQAAVRLRRDVPADLPELHADADRLQQVLVNLINNAVDAMPDGGELRIAARRQDHQILLSVTDTGKGIEPEDMKRLFDPFFSTKQGKGTGLGLSISYGIVRDHGGKIWAESRPRQGSTFFVLLPTAEAPGA